LGHFVFTNFVRKHSGRPCPAYEIRMQAIGDLGYCTITQDILFSSLKKGRVCTGSYLESHETTCDGATSMRVVTLVVRCDWKAANQLGSISTAIQLLNTGRPGHLCAVASEPLKCLVRSCLQSTEPE
jgi:hypothetical protein